MPCFVHFFLVTAVEKLLKSVKIWQSCSQIYTVTFDVYSLYRIRNFCSDYRPLYAERNRPGLSL